MKAPAAALAAALLLLPACVPHAPPLSAGERAVFFDPYRDPAHPARNRQLVIPSGPVRPELGRPAEMNALFFQAAGPGPKPTLLLLHGLPGNERNLDLAQAVRRSGWNVLTFTYRGAWGSEGTFSIQHAVADAGAALGFLRSPRAAADFAVDPARIVVAGHSMGGYAAADLAAREPVAGLILLDAWNIADTARQAKGGGAAGRAALVANFDDLGHAVDPITAGDIADGVLSRGEQWDLLALAPRLARTPVLSLWATHGLAAHNRAFAETLRPLPGARIAEREIDSDHAFADSRMRVATEVVGWLQALPPR